MTTNRVLNSGRLLAIVSLMGCYNLTGRTAADAGDAVADAADVRQSGDAQGDLNALDATDAADLPDALDTPQADDVALDTAADAVDALEASLEDADVVSVDASEVAVDACALAVCSGACIDTRSDVRHCGSCERDCTTLSSVMSASVRCEAGACVIPAGACDAAHGDCDGDTSNGCEEDLTRSSNCGACGTVCSEPTPLCAMMGSSRRCVSGCDGASTRCGMTCSNTANDPANCGACDNVCPVPSGGVAACASGRCGVLCDAGFHLCAGRCVDDTAVTSCGARCEPCPMSAHATATCAAGVCGFTCDASFADCDGNASNGCETDTRTSGAHCGRCDNACTAPTGSVASCVAGRCEVMLTCSAGQVLCGASCQTVGATCTVGVGACARTGTMVCSAAGGSTTCSVTPGVSTTETCDGIDNDCDGLTDEGFCRIGGVCFTDRQANPANACQWCVASPAVSASPVWSNAPAGLVCRVSVGLCDVAETCDGTGAACPADRFMAAGVVCRASAGVCDVAEVCTGSSVVCPTNAYAPVTAVCRASVGLCDRAETCTGSAATCPADAFQPAGTVCRASSTIAACDPQESCTGASVTCPADVVTRTPTTETCDNVDNNCDGVVDEPPAASTCPTRANATATCTAGSCGFTCNAGYDLSGGACVAPRGMCPAPAGASMTAVINDDFTSGSLDSRVFAATGTVSVATGILSIAASPTSTIRTIQFSAPAVVEVRGLLPQTSVTYNHMALGRCGGYRAPCPLEFWSFSSHWENATVQSQIEYYTPAFVREQLDTTYSATAFHTYRFVLGESAQEMYIDDVLVRRYALSVPRGTSWVFFAGTGSSTTSAQIDWIRVQSPSSCDFCPP